MTFILVTTTRHRTGPGEAFPVVLSDKWTHHLTRAEADKAYAAALQLDNLYTASVCAVLASTDYPPAQPYTSEPFTDEEAHCFECGAELSGSELADGDGLCVGCDGRVKGWSCHTHAEGRTTVTPHICLACDWVCGLHRTAPVTCPNCGDDCDSGEIAAQHISANPGLDMPPVWKHSAIARLKGGE